MVAINNISSGATHVHSCGPQCNHDQDSLFVDSVTGNEASATDLIRGQWNTTNLKFKFLETAPSYYSSGAEEKSGFDSFTDSMKSATVEILNHIETFTNIKFTETSNESQYGVVTFAQATLPSGTGAWAYYPTFSHFGGDVWTNNRYNSTTDMTLGKYGYFTLMHEIGHALGLQHSFAVYDGQEATSQYSVMAYNWTPGYSQSYQLYDIASLQAAYGANTSYNIGDDTYVLKNKALYTIWDAGGNDTLDAAHIITNVVLDLEDGAFSSVGKTNNIAIAYDAIIENANGGSGHDIISGNDANNILNGNAGNDAFHETDGNDTLNGGDGIDTVYFLEEFQYYSVVVIDTITLALTNLITSFVDTITNIEQFFFSNINYSFSDVSTLSGDYDAVFLGSDRARDVIDGSALKDFIDGKNNHDNLHGHDGDDIIKGGHGNDRLYGGAGNDNLDGGTGNDFIYGDDGNDVINGGTYHDRIYGGSGDDIIDGGDHNDRIYGEGGNDTINGGNHNDYVFGGDGDDIIEGGNGINRLYGESGNDRIIGGNYFDIIIGGEGNDYISGGAYRDILQGNEGDDEIHGGDGYDTIYGGDGNDKIYGGDYNDRLYGNDGNDLIDGGEGNDFIIGGSGDDIMTGGNGHDRLYANDGNDVLIGGEGNDYLLGYDGDDVIDGGEGHDRAYGGNGNDTITGGNGNDYILGHNGDDVMYGDDGNDRIYGHNGDDLIYGGDGNDFLLGYNNNDTIYGDAGDDRLYGHNGNDVLHGGTGNDILLGYNHNDILFGGDGNDRLIGGYGDDILNGGAGNDLLYGQAGFDTFVLDDNSTENTIIVDFHYAYDKFDLTDILENYDALTDDINDFLQITQVGRNTFLEADKDGAENGANFTAIAQVNGLARLSVDDLVEKDLIV